MNDVERALAQVAHIRERMAASTQFRGFAPEAVALTGLLAFAAAAAQSAWPDALAPDALRFVAFWAGIAAVAVAVIGSEAVARSRRLHGRMAPAMLGGTIRQFAPFGAAGAAVAVVICRVSPGTAWMLPGLWQILIALSVCAALPSLPRAVAWVAGWYFAAGLAVLAWAGGDGNLSPWMMGVPFGIGQGLVALALHRAGGGSHGGH